MKYISAAFVIILVPAILLGQSSDSLKTNIANTKEFRSKITAEYAANYLVQNANGIIIDEQWEEIEGRKVRIIQMEHDYISRYSYRTIVDRLHEKQLTTFQYVQQWKQEDDVINAASFIDIGKGGFLLTFQYNPEKGKGTITCGYVKLEK